MVTICGYLIVYIFEYYVNDSKPWDWKILGGFDGRDVDARLEGIAHF